MGRIGRDELSPELLSLLEKLISPPDVLNDYYTKEEIDLLITEINNYLDIVLTVDMTYTKEIIDWKLGLITDKLNGIQTIDTYTKTEIDTKMNALRKLINSKMDKDSLYTKDEVKQLIDDAVNAALPNVSDFYTKSEIDTKLTGFLTKADIVDALTTDTDKPISVNQMNILNNKIDDLKQSASNGSQQIATAIAGIGIDLGSVPTNPWNTYRDAILNFKREMTEDDYMNQIPDEVILIKDLGEEFTNTVSLCGFDIFSGNYYIISGTTIYEYDNTYTLSRSVNLSLKKSFSTVNRMIFSSKFICAGNIIIKKASLEVLSESVDTIAGITSDDVVIYKTNVIVYPKKTYFDVYVGFMNGSDFVTQSLGTFTTYLSNVVSMYESDNKVMIFINILYNNQTVLDICELYKDGDTYKLSSFVQRLYLSTTLSNSMVINNNRIINATDYIQMPELVKYKYEYNTDNDYYESLNYGCSNITFDGTSKLIYRITNGTLYVRYLNDILYSFNTKTTNGYGYIHNLYYDILSNCIYFDTFKRFGSGLKIYKITFKPK